MSAITTLTMTEPLSALLSTGVSLMILAALGCVALRRGGA